MKWKAIFISFKGLSMKEKRQNFFEGERPNLDVDIGINSKQPYFLYAVRICLTLCLISLSG